MSKTLSKPTVTIPPLYRRYRRLVAIPEATYRRLVVPLEDLPAATANREPAWQALLRGPKGLMRPAEIDREIQAYRREQRRAVRP